MDIHCILLDLGGMGEIFEADRSDNPSMGQDSQETHQTGCHYDPRGHDQEILSNFCWSKQEEE